MQVFNCRRCERGGDGIAMAGFVLGVDFKAALSWLVGERDIALDPAEVERRRRKAEGNARQREFERRRYRDASIKRARNIWEQSVPATGTAVQDYLAIRGITGKSLPTLPVAIRFHGALPYMVKNSDGGWLELHRGPAMVGAIQGPDKRFMGVHRTWIDLDQTKGKVKLSHDGEDLSAKKIEGAHKGGAIRLRSAKNSTTLIMGEGLETTFTAVIADAIPGAGYWCGVSLPNMGGKRILRGKGMKFAGIPDIGDETAWVPPPWVQRLIFIQDGDSEAKPTRAKLLAGLRRAMHNVPGLKAQIVHPGAGIDLNDQLMSMSAVDD